MSNPSHRLLSVSRHRSVLAISAAVMVASLLTPSAALAAPSSGVPSAAVATASTASPSVLDRFERSVASGWGVAEVGGTWQTTGTHSVGAGVGVQRVDRAGQSRTAVLSGYTSTSTDLTVDVALDKVPSGGHAWVSVVGRSVDASGDYRARLRVAPGGVVSLLAARGETTLATAALPDRLTAGAVWSVRVEVVGAAPTTLRAKAWPAGALEPADWQVSVTDGTSTLQRAGGIAVSTYASSSATNAPLTLRIPSLEVAAPNQAPVAAVSVSATDLEVVADGGGSTDPDGTIGSYAWTMGDGTRLTGRSVQHTYAVAGSYLVELTVTDDDGATATARRTVTAVAPNQVPVAHAVVDDAGLAITADGSQSTDPDGAIVRYEWAFGDGSTAVGDLVEHSYAADGDYLATLTVVDDRGGRATATVELSVEAPAPEPGLVKPSASNTGVPAGTQLTVHRGDLTITTPGTVIDGLDIHGFVTIRAADVTIRNSIVRGSGPGTFNTGLINCNHKAVQNAVIEDVTLVPSYPSVWINGVLGHDYTARRVNTYHVVDGFGIYNIHGPAANVTVESSYVHDLSYFSPDPNHSDNRTHNDAVQIQGGTNISIQGNFFSAYLSKEVGTQTYRYPQAGFGVILTPNVSAVSNAHITDNWFEGSYIPVKLTTGKRGPMDFGTVSGNRFARDMRNTPMNGVNQWFTILMTPDMTAETVGNVYDDNDEPVVVRHDSGTATAP